MAYLKKILALLPVSLQEELKRYYLKFKIKTGSFKTTEPEYDELKNFVSEGQWVIDVGANIGHYTLKLSELVGKTGRVISFEPMPITFGHLSGNVLHSKFSNVTLLNAAASDGTSAVGMAVPNFSSGLKNYYQANISENGDAVGNTSVMTFAIDDLSLPEKVALVKIDAEGHEPAVFRGMKKLLERDKPTLIVESVDEEIRGSLIALGYAEEVLPGSPNVMFTA